MNKFIGNSYLQCIFTLFTFSNSYLETKRSISYFRDVQTQIGKCYNYLAHGWLVGHFC